jgi:hypothetical protein
MPCAVNDHLVHVVVFGGRLLRHILLSLLILLWQMDSIHKKAPSDMSLRFSVSMVALRR